MDLGDERDATVGFCLSVTVLLRFEAKELGLFSASRLSAFPVKWADETEMIRPKSSVEGSTTFLSS